MCAAHDDNSSLTAPRLDPYAAFRVPGLLRYMLGSLLIQIGMGAQGMAIGWDLYQRTGQPLSLGLVGGIQAIPMLLLSLPAGWLADRFERRKVIALCLGGVAVCSLGLAWLSYIKGPISWMYLLLFLDATLMTLQRPSGAAIFPSLVPPDRLENAMKWRTSSFQVSGMIGPALGAAIIKLSVPAAYAACSLAALVFIVLLLSLRLKPSPAAAGAMSLSSVLAGL